jgi:hypothetical protein
MHAADDGVPSSPLLLLLLLLLPPRQQLQEGICSTA